MSEEPICPQCGLSNTYQDDALWVCADCGFEWSAESTESADALVVKDSHGNVLNDGDSVIVIKDLKVRGSSSVVKVGTKVKSIKLVTGDHNIDCKIDGIGPMKLKSEFVKKA